MPVTGLHHHVAAIALRVAGDHGFALGGGNALIAHGIIDRPTQDVDLFTDDEHGVEAAAGAVEEALQAEGFTVERVDKTAGLSDIFPGMGEGLAEWAVTAPDGTRMQLQMAYFWREHAPVILEIGPVLDLEDVAAGKACALAGRVEPRDYLDGAALLQHFTAEQMIALAQKLDPGLEARDFAEAGRRLNSPQILRRFALAGLSEERIAWIQDQFAGWPR